MLEVQTVWRCSSTTSGANSMSRKQSLLSISLSLRIFFFLSVCVITVMNIWLSDMHFQHSSFFSLEYMNIFKCQCSGHFGLLHLHANCTASPLQILPLQWDWQKAMPEGSVSSSVMMCNLIRLFCLSLSLWFSLTSPLVTPLSKQLLGSLSVCALMGCHACSPA